MPELTGLELAEMLYMEHRNIPLILASGDLSEKVVDWGMRLGIRWYLDKPYTAETLHGMAKAALNASNAS